MSKKNIINTNEFSFILKPSGIEGVGVFAAHAIAKGAYLKVFDNKEKLRKLTNAKIKDKFFQRYCVEFPKYNSAPENFSRMSIGWYLNHSAKPNAAHRSFKYYATRNIKAGEEITIDYNTLEL